MPIVGGDNLRGLYSFHPGGVTVALADGAVRTIAPSIAPAAMFALVTRDGDEMPAFSDVR